MQCDASLDEPKTQTEIKELEAKKAEMAAYFRQYESMRYCKTLQAFCAVRPCPESRASNALFDTGDEHAACVPFSRACQAGGSEHTVAGCGRGPATPASSRHLVHLYAFSSHISRANYVRQTWRRKRK